MKAKINLTIEQNLFEQIKLEALKHQKSVSDLLEEYLTNTFISVPKKQSGKSKKNLIEMVRELPALNTNGDLIDSYYQQFN